MLKNNRIRGKKIVKREDFPSTYKDRIYHTLEEARRDYPDVNNVGRTFSSLREARDYYGGSD